MIFAILNRGKVIFYYSLNSMFCCGPLMPVWLAVVKRHPDLIAYDSPRTLHSAFCAAKKLILQKLEVILHLI